MSITRINVLIHMRRDLSIDIPSATDEIKLRWDLDEYPDERERVREIIGQAWSELYNDKAVVQFGDECPDCLGVGYHKSFCPSTTLRRHWIR